MATTSVPTDLADVVWHRSSIDGTNYAALGVAKIVEFPAFRDVPALYVVDAEGRGDSRNFDSVDDAFADALAADEEAQR